MLRSIRSAGTLLPISMLSCVLGACAPLNTELTIGDPLRTRDQVVLPSIGRGAAGGSDSRSRVRARDMATRIRPDAAPARPESDPISDETPEPSITSLDRSHWDATRFLVPNDQVTHQPRYTRNEHFNRTSARARGEHPTMRSALDSSTTPGRDQQIKEAAAAPFLAAADIALLPLRAVAARPWQRTRTGFERYQRAPEERSVVPEGLLPVDDQAEAPIGEPAPQEPRQNHAPESKP